MVERAWWFREDGFLDVMVSGDEDSVWGGSPGGICFSAELMYPGKKQEEQRREEMGGGGMWNAIKDQENKNWIG